ncbi:MFS transporter [Pyruvatibacter sp.]|uniref:MFS transporter n=1 Tax=Pyruvatibacter sp. TaxID=1981328 RepID=UPI0032EACCB9
MTDSAIIEVQTHSLTDAQRRRSMAAALGCIGAVGIGLGATLPLLALRMDAMGASATIIGLNTAMVGLSHLIFTPLVPLILRRIPMMTFLILCIFASTIGIMGYVLFPSIWVWFPLRFFTSAALAGLFIVSEIWVNQIADEKTRGRAIGMYATVFAGSFAIGPLILLGVGTSGALPFLITAGMTLLAIIPLMFARGLMPNITEKPSRSFLAFILVAPAATFAALAYGAIETQVFNLLPVYSVRSGATEAVAALVLSVFAAGNVALQIPIGLLADKFDRRYVLAGCAAVGIAGPLLIPFTAGQPMLLYPVLFVYGGVVVGLYTVGLALLGQRFRGADLAAANAAFVVMYSLGALVGPAAGGVAMDINNPNGLMVALTVIAACALIITLWRRFTEGPALPGEMPKPS